MTKEELKVKVAKQQSIINDANNQICSDVKEYIETLPYKVGDKIVQFHLETSDNIMLIKTDELNKTERGDNGYGSSDKK
jgi:dUTPase